MKIDHWKIYKTPIIYITMDISTDSLNMRANTCEAQ